MPWSFRSFSLSPGKSSSIDFQSSVQSTHTRQLLPVIDCATLVIAVVATHPQAELKDWLRLTDHATRDMTRVHAAADLTGFGFGEQSIRVGMDYGVEGSVSYFASKVKSVFS